MQGEGRELTESIYARVQTFQKALDAASAAQGKPKLVLSVSAQPAHTGVPYMESPSDPALSDSVVQAAGTPSTTHPATPRPGCGAGRSPTSAGSEVTGTARSAGCSTTASWARRCSTPPTSGRAAGTTWT
ncbi:hypothetical protein GXW82_15850 [Streptacidiphilus sp. 4-A2]|nr:hypothetical protein [Streptacidiphilus sp. 4-A2]